MSIYEYELQSDGTYRRVEVKPADMVSVVRCRDCSLCVEKGYRLYCDRDAGGFPEVEPDGFCAWGERRDA